MIPKVIHYCWFGGNPLPDSAVKCIDSWRQYFPGYEIKEWNESNFDLQCCDYVREAYEAGKWAFVSDYARFWILYHEGGLYFDTDVEAIRPFDDILENGPFMGCENSDAGISCIICGVNPGLGLGTTPGLELYREVLDFYQARHFLDADGNADTTTVVYYMSHILYAHGWRAIGEIEEVCGVHIYPAAYFCPMDYDTGKVNITDCTHSIHWYKASWFTKGNKMAKAVDRWCLNHFGKGNRIHRVLDFPFRVMGKIEKLGFVKTLQFAWQKLAGDRHA